MTIQTDLRNVTDRIIAARRILAQAELDRLSRRADVANVEANLAHTRTYLMARAEAGTNDHQRRAFAQAETAGLSRGLSDTEAELLAAERWVVIATADLRQAEDERRYLELVAQMAIAGVADAAPAPVVMTYANGDSGEVFAL